MKNLQNWKKFNENYPPGAEHDSRAPWNQKSPDYETVEFDDFLQDEDENKFPVHITYTYAENDESIRKIITDYSYEIKVDAPSLNKDYIDEDVRMLIGQHISGPFDWEC